MKPDKSIQIKLRNTAYPALIFLFFITLCFIFFSSSERESLRKSAEQSLSDISNYKANFISNWYKEEISDAELITGSKNLLRETEEYLNSGLSDYDFEKSINQIKTEHSYSDIYVFDTQGEYLHSSNPAIVYDDSLELRNLSDALSSGKTFVSDIYISKNDKKRYIDIFTFIRNDDDIALACVIFRIEPESYLSERFPNWPFYHDTVKSTIIKKDKDGSVYKYNDSDTIELCWIKIDTLISDNKLTLSNKSGLYLKGLNDRKNFISVTRDIPDTPWSIVVRSEKKEVFKTLNMKYLDYIVLIIIMFICYSTIIYYLIHISHSKSINKKLNEKKVKIEYKQRFEMLMDLIDEGVLITDSSGLIKSMNIKYQTLTGYIFNELINVHVDNVFSLIDNSTGINVFNFRQTLVEHAGLINYSDVQLVVKNGSSIPVVCEITPLMDDSDGHMGIMISVRDMYDVQNMHKVISEGEDLLLKLFQNYPDAALLADIYGNIEQANVICNDVLGYTMTEMKRIKVNDIFPDGNLIDKYLNESVNVISDIRKKIKVKRRDGSEFCAEVYISTVNYKNRRLIEIFIKNYPENEASKFDFSYEGENLKDALIANMNHEIRTPLNDIIGFSHIIRDKGLTSEEISKYADLISSSSERLLGMLNNLIDISKIEAGLESINNNTFLITDLIKSVYSEYINLAKIKDLEYRLTIPENSKGLKAVGDYLKLSTILSHFLSNAFKFTNRGYVEIGLNFNDENIHFFVKDTGLPIKESDQKKIFERFFQSDVSISSGVDGAGLGLAICKGYSDLLGCKIWFESSGEIGKTFFLELPRQQKS